MTMRQARGCATHDTTCRVWLCQQWEAVMHKGLHMPSKALLQVEAVARRIRTCQGGRRGE